MNSATRTIDGTLVPASGTWTIDPGHAQVGFVGRHFALTKIRGVFGGVTGEVVIAENIQESSVSVDIDVASLGTGDATRDDHLRSEDLFDVLEYPNATFRSTKVTVDGSTGTMAGVLTIKDVSKEISLDVKFRGHARDPWENERAVFSASAKINREDWGLTWNMVLDTGGLLVSKEILLEIEVELIRQ